MTTPEKRAATLEKILAAPDLPSPSASAVALVRLTQDESVSLRQIEQAIQVDPAFVARLIQVANSARYGLPGRPIVSVKDALIVLGLPAIRGLAIGFSLFDSQRKGECPQFDNEAFWIRSLVMAQAFQRIAARIKAAPADEAFVVGLLANIGALALAAGFPTAYGKLLDEASVNTSVTVESLETQSLGFSHWELSAELMIRWGLPEVYARPVAAFGSGSGKSLNGRIAQISNSLALAATYANLIADSRHRTQESLGDLYRQGARLSLSAEDLLGLGKDISHGFRQWSDMLELRVEHWVHFDWVEEAERNPQFLDQGNPFYSKPLKVLVVEDDRASGAMIAMILRDEGYVVLEASSSREALEIAEQESPEIILTDWVMPDMDGIELIRRIRSKEWGRDSYMLVITAQTEEEHLVTAFEAGSNDFITKPIKPRILAARMKAGERVVRLQRERERQFAEMRDLAGELSESNRRLQELAVTDALTGCPNRRYALERLHQEWSTAERHGVPLSCLVVDLDYFKQVNDVHGHDRGDAVLRLVADTLRKGVREEDVVCRVGGDEFWILCPNSSLSAASVCAERLCAMVDHLAIMAGNVQCTISVGVAERSSDMDAPAALIEAADRNLYKAKRAGRARAA